MLSETPYDHISPTAKLIAYARTFSDIPFAREIAAACDAEETAQAIVGSLPAFLADRLPGLEIRYKMTEKLITRQGITQVLEIAAGLSPHALAMTNDPQMVYVATDLPKIIGQSQALAESILTKLGLHRPHLSFRPANGLHLDELIQAAAPFRSDQPIAIVTEGLLLYLTRAEQTVLANNIHHLLTLYHGTWITADAYTMPTEDEIKRNTSGSSWYNQLASTTGSTFEDNIFLDQDDRDQFFTRAGFTIETHFGTEIYEELSLFNYLEISRERVLELARDYQVLALTI